MNYLLDTHVLLWTLFEPSRLSKSVRELLLNEEHEIFVSTVSLWEISLKFSLGKLYLQNITPDELPSVVTQSGFEIISLNESDAATFHKLPKISHADPFDRMLIWQAIRNNLTMVSRDDRFLEYIPLGLTLVWK